MIRICQCGKEYEYTSVLLTEYENLISSTNKEDIKKAEIIKPKLDFEISLCPNICEKCATERVEAYEKNLSQESENDNENDKLDALGIRPRHYSCTFETFKPRSDEETGALDACKRMALSKRGIIALIGNNGTGKTHLACSVIRDIGAGKIYKMIEIGMVIREAFKPNNTKTEQEQLDYLVRLPFLAIDEADKSKRTDNEMSWLSYIIDERNERYKPTILIANCHPRAIHKDAPGCDKCFEAIMTPDVLDRISQSGVIRYFSGESNRRELRGKE